MTHAAAAPIAPVGPEVRRKLWTVEEVYRAVDAGIFAGQRFEVIAGEIIDKMGQNPMHASGLMYAVRQLIEIFGIDFVRAQLPLALRHPEGLFSEPEPDIVVCSGHASDFTRKHPVPAEVRLVVEISDSSLRIDTTTKRDLYARSSIPEYWVVDLAQREVLVFRHPVAGAYTQIETRRPGQSISPLAAPEQAILVDELLPPAE